MKCRICGKNERTEYHRISFDGGGYGIFDWESELNEEGIELSNSNVTITNKSKLIVDNTTAYQSQGYRNDYGHILQLSTYYMLKGNVVYRLIFRDYNQNESLPIEQKIVKSFRFI